MAVKDAIVKALVESEIVELMVKTGVENVYMEDGTTTLAAKLAEMTTSVEGAVTEETMNSAISTAIDNLIAGAPGTYDTLKEIADYIAAHEEVTTALNAAIGNKVDKVEGKGLSTNDYTTEEKNKLAGIAEGAQVNVIEKISVNGTAQTITKKVSEILEISTHKEDEKTGKKKKRLSAAERQQMIEQLTKEMRAAAKLLEFEHAAYLRDKIKQLKGEK